MSRPLKPAPTFSLTDEERGWLAGIIEGEGCMTINKNKRPIPQIMLYVSSTDKDIVDRIHALTGVGSVKRLPDHYERLGTKPVYKWVVSARNEVLAVLAEIEPLLGKRRSKRAEELRSVSI